jgi:hypothetical protein
MNMNPATAAHSAALIIHPEAIIVTEIREQQITAIFLSLTAQLTIPEKKADVPRSKRKP